jgi:hypothetical protein
LVLSSFLSFGSTKKEKELKFLCHNFLVIKDGLHLFAVTPVAPRKKALSMSFHSNYICPVYRNLIKFNPENI